MTDASELESVVPSVIVEGAWGSLEVQGRGAS